MFQYFNHSLMRRYLLAFGSLFTKVSLARVDSGATEVQRLLVPIEYGPKEKWYTRLTKDPNLTQGVSQILPRLAYEVSGISYDNSRKLNTLNPLSFPNDDARKLSRIYVGVPYTINFNLVALVKLQQDGLQIVEQILPYFTPDLTMAISVVPELGLVDQVPITLQSVATQDNYEGDFETRRAIEWTLTFSMKVYFYGPRRKQNRIEEIFVDIYNSPLADSLDSLTYLQSESRDLFLQEDEGGHIADESTANTFLTSGRVARVHVVADPREQYPADKDDIDAIVTLLEDDGDKRRTFDMSDEDA